MIVHPSLGAWRNRTAHKAALQALHAAEPLVGSLDPSRMQVCPQNPGQLGPSEAHELRQAFPQTRFRLHANAHAAGWSSQADASTQHLFAPYFEALGQLSSWLDGEAYTWHAGLRQHATLTEVLSRTLDLEQAWGIPVGIEGLYPTADARYLLSTWAEYAQLLESGVRYALDLSHLNIVRAAEGLESPASLVRELLSSPQCLEIHLSANDGTHDMHAQVGTEPWWWDDLQRYATPAAHIFSEGGQIVPRIL